jgi:hypothetical protein
MHYDMYVAPHIGWEYIGQKDSLQSQTHVNAHIPQCEQQRTVCPSDIETTVTGLGHCLVLLCTELRGQLSKLGSYLTQILRSVDNTKRLSNEG